MSGNIYLVEKPHRNALYDENRTVARAWVQIVQTHFPPYGAIITPPRVWRQIVRWIVFFKRNKILYFFN